MATFFLLLIYLTFVSLGLPDAAQGAAWPMMRLSFGAPLEAAGPIAMVVTSCTVVSTLLCDRLVARFGTGRVTAASVLLTALALLANALSPAYWLLCVAAVPLGLGAGCIDAALNNYVALHYSARHMNWLHCFWGIGASAGPLLMSLFLQKEDGWRGGYFVIAGIQFVLTAILFATLPLWKKQVTTPPAQAVQPAPPRERVLRMPGLAPALLVLLFYCAAEWSMGLWASSFLADVRGLSAAEAARGASLVFAGITGGRFLAGLFSARFASKVLVRGGLCFITAGALLLMLPLPSYALLAGAGLVGLGCAPIFPAMLHETPARFGKENSQKIVSLQMAAAYVGNLIFPPLLGFVAAKSSLVILPYFVFFCGALILVLTERINRTLPAGTPAA